MSITDRRRNTSVTNYHDELSFGVLVAENRKQLIEFVGEQR